MTPFLINKKFTLFFVLFLGFILHIGGVCLLYNLPMNPSSHAYENSIHKHEEFVEHQKRQNRTELIADIFNYLSNEQQTLEVKTELQIENAPHLDLVFPQGIDFSLETADFEFESSIPKVSLEETNSLPIEAKRAFMAPLPLLSLLESPSLDFDIERAIQEGDLACSEHFDIDVEYAPKRSRPGYVFKVTFLPRSEVQFKRITQNFYFLIDRSNSIPRARYALNKKAVAEALEHLKPGDRFNILIFDDHVVRFSEKLVATTEESIQKAHEFLHKHGHGGLFAATELYASLGKIIPNNVAEDELNTAILLSDGDTYLSLEKQRRTIGGWTAHNHGKVALYTVASGSGNNLPLLDLISSFNKGALLYTPEHQKVGERLAYLMRTLQNPIGKQVVATAIPRDKSMNVLLQPKTSRIPDLYQNRPFVIYGSTNRLDDFVLFLQGRYYDKRFDIKKTIRLSDAKIGSYAIERGWTQLIAQEFYEHYFQEGDVTHLESAKQLLAPHNLSIPFSD